jgi:D-arabinose 1-dehydrogenase-like Zn-dependent alcohol dehydrogenase
MANRFVQVSKANGPFEIVEREIPEPAPGQVRIKVQACGICHSDSLVKEGMFPGIQYPRVPGHEVAGIIDKIGSRNGETKWTPGQRVGVGWNGGYCGQCERCRHGDFFACIKAGVTGITYDGGYADYMVAPVEALALVPDEISATEAAPLMCAGITTYNALRNSGARVGDVVAVLGVGGVGHLGIQFATKMGFKTIAIARGKDKEELAKKLGAKHYIDSQSQNPAEEIVKIGREEGGAKVILATVTNAKAMTSVIGGLGVNGKLIIIGAPNEPLEVPIFPLLTGRQSIMGWYSGTSIDSQDTLSFSALSGVRSLNETFPLEKVSEAYDLMIKGKARFRAVLTM